MKKETVITILESLMAESVRRFSEKEKALKIRNWCSKLKDVTDEQGWKGLDKALDCEYIPPVGIFKEMCLSGSGSQSLEDEAKTKWALVMKNLDRTSSPVFKDSCIAEAIRNTGGWKRLCNMIVDPREFEKSEEPFRRMEFIDHYLIARRQKIEFPNMLRGKFKDYKFIGYAPEDDKQAILKQIENRENQDRKILNMICGR